MKPILFNTQMVQAICKGHKTATRRIIKLKDAAVRIQMITHPKNPKHVALMVHRPDGKKVIIEPPVQPGDILYVRETWSFWPCWDCDNDCNAHQVHYKGEQGCFVYKTQANKVPHNEQWHPSIHMPKEAARIFLRVTGIRAEPLHAMTIDDFRKEGIRLSPREETACKCEGQADVCRDIPCEYRDVYLNAKYTEKFAKLWDSTIREDRLVTDSYEKNPFVWVIEFERKKTSGEGGL